MSQPDVGHNYNRGRPPCGVHVTPNQHLMDYTITVRDVERCVWDVITCVYSVGIRDV